MSSIAFGVAALVAIDSFAGNVTGSIRAQSRTLLGGDLSMNSRADFPSVVDILLDSLSGKGIPNARVTNFASMALAERTGGTRLVQVRAVSKGYPFYGSIETVPAGGWSSVHDAPVVFVDPSLLVSLDAVVGDSIKLGVRRFRIAGTLGDVPGDPGIAAVIGPRIFISDKWIGSTGLLKFGSRADYSIVLRLPESLSGTKQASQVRSTILRRLYPDAAARLEAADTRARGAPPEDEPDTTQTPDSASAPRDSAANGLASRTPAQRIRVRTVADTERDFTEAVSRLADFLSIVGLIALLLGGIGVASGVNAFVSAKIDTVAVLRCLGATSRQVLALYVVQAIAMGFVGALTGVALGVGVQFMLPRVVNEFLPIDVAISLEPRPLMLGLATGVWVALIFAMRPLLALRRVSPLQAIRRDADAAALPKEWKDPARLTVDALLVGSLVAIIVARIGTLRDGLIISAAITAAVGVLWVAATLLIALARRSVVATWPFTLRQGIANLHRPANQTRAVTLALGFGAFLLSTVYLVQANLLGRVQATADSSAGNLLFFDVQDNQALPLDSMLRERQDQVVQRTPIVTMRVDAINGRSIMALRADTSIHRARWALRREYRSTYREGLAGSEELAEGKWFPDSAERARTRAANPDAPFLISVEKGLMNELGVKLGDTITWNVQGVPVRTIVHNTRTVNFARFEANFFVVFAPEAIRRAPQQYVFVANVPPGSAISMVSRDVVRRFPNVSILDLTLVRQTIGSIVNRVILAIRFLGIFSLGMGIPVLFSAVAATRRARLREGVLLRTLGASRAQVLKVLLAEYFALGALGALTGMLLAFAGAWGVTHFIFKDPFKPAIGATLIIGTGMLALTVLIGWMTSRDVYRATPMQAIRES